MLSVAQEKTLYEEKDKLMQAHLITSSSELIEELQAVDKEPLSAAKVETLKTQVQIRKKSLRPKCIYNIYLKP